jgi:hypothetical protein
MAGPSQIDSIRNDPANARVRRPCTLDVCKRRKADGAYRRSVRPALVAIGADMHSGRARELGAAQTSAAGVKPMAASVRRTPAATAASFGNAHDAMIIIAQGRGRNPRVRAGRKTSGERSTQQN